MEADTKDVDIRQIVEFIEALLTNIIHHRNQLKHYRNTVKTAISLFDCIEIDLDFSEKLKVPLKYEPQSMHWTNSQVIVHSGISKVSGEKTYHPYFSDDKVQDYVFVSIALSEMMNEQEDIDGKTIVVGADNCVVQYKCAVHFECMQELATTVVRLYSVPGHGKGEVDDVGGIPKVEVRREVAAGKKLQFGDEMVEFLSGKINSKTDPAYKFKNITTAQLEEARAEERLKVYSTIEGSSKFQAIVFKPNQKMKASPRICLCKECKDDYGSCALFKEYEINIKHLKKICLRSSIMERISAEIQNPEDAIDDTPAADALLKDVAVALAAEKKAHETFYLMNIIQEEEWAEKDETDAWGTEIRAGQLHLRG